MIRFHGFINKAIIFILGAIFGFLADKILEEAWITLQGRPAIIVNVLEAEPMALGLEPEVKNFSLLFITANDSAIIARLSTKDLKLRKKYGRIMLHDHLVASGSQREYSITLKNIGRASANDIVINLKSKSMIKVLDNDARVESQCGNLFSAQGCQLKISTLAQNEEIFLTLLSQAEGIFEVECLIDGNNSRCKRNFMHTKISQYQDGLILEINGATIVFPPINPDRKIKHYVYMPKENNWRQFSLESTPNEVINIRTPVIPFTP